MGSDVLSTKRVAHFSCFMDGLNVEKSFWFESVCLCKYNDIRDMKAPFSVLQVTNYRSFCFTFINGNNVHFSGPNFLHQQIINALF